MGDKLKALKAELQEVAGELHTARTLLIGLYLGEFSAKVALGNYFHPPEMKGYACTMRRALTGSSICMFSYGCPRPECRKERKAFEARMRGKKRGK